ncbi:competence protein ComEA [Arthrobacter pityocampae]|uniref:Competence protein ComEA n=1 Tax=Arthrobacter pityocampae TaxID=547334 RepID=A0A2S5IZE1_9MICC|nr:ComEA family DNA-binding protein [Arthrobacter pityocampae]PPB49901.1 competence protein ComEA [Arthrobacter pityocampae]
MGKHRWPTAGDAWAPPRTLQPPDPDGADDSRHVFAEDGGPPPPGGIQWRVARSAALVFLGVALAVGAALFLVRSSEPSAAAVSVQLDAESPARPDGPGPGESGPDDAPSGSGGASPGPVGAPPDPVGDSTLPGGPSGAPSMSGPREGSVVVYVTGAVASPGVITVPAGTRLVDVIERAGGPLPEADLEGINLASMPADGQHIHLLAAGEEPRTGTAQPPLPASAPGGPGAWTGPGAGGPAGADGAAGAGAPGPSAGIIDLNTAALPDIETLPGVGPVLGQRIIDWREEHGPFAQASDVDAVPGIGPALLEGILPLVTVR